MAKVGLARVTVFSPFVIFLTNGGSPVDRHLTTAGINPAMLSDPSALIPLHWACEFVTAVGHAEGIDNFGFEVGAKARIADMGDFGRALQQSLTLKNLLERLMKWVPAMDSGARIWTEKGTTPDHLKLCIKHAADIGRPIADAYGLMIMIDAIRMALGPDWRPRRYWIDQAAGSQLHQYEALSDGIAIRETRHLAFEIPRAALSRPLNKSHPGSPLSTNGSTPPPDDLIGSLGTAIETGLGNRLPVINEAAELTGLSSRTLQRRLREHGLTYRQLVDRIRFEHANTLLAESSQSIREISAHLGYSDPANFSHAFQRWTGRSPSELRARA